MIDPNDYTIQTAIYSKNGIGRWKVLGYCSEPSLTMINIDTDERRSFGVRGLANTEFERIDELVFDYETNTIKKGLRND